MVVVRVSHRRRWLAGPVAVVATALVVAVGMTPAPVAEAATTFDGHLTRVPYLTDLVSLHVNVNWATDQSASTGSVQWGPVTAGTCTLTSVGTATRRTITIAFATGTVSEYQWTASLGLPEQGRYCYRPLLAGSDLLAGNASPSFTTQATAGDASAFSFAVFGDWGQVDANGNNPDQAKLLAQVAASGARFAVTVGDNGYTSGSQANYGDLQHTAASTSAIFGPSFWTVAGSSIPLFTAVGNHGLSGTSHTDITTWTQDQAVASSGGSYTNGTYTCCSGSTVNYGNEWYAFDAGAARFYVLDSAWGDTNGGSSTPYAQDAANHFAPGAAEYQWLLADLKAHPTVMKFAFSHYPWYSDSSSQTSDTSLQGGSSLEGLLGQYGVKIAFNGHAHVYQRNRPSGTGMPVTYLTGGGGATLGPIGPCSAIDAYGIGWSPTKLTGYACGGASVPTSAGQVFHFLKVTVAGSTVTVTPTDENGNTFDVQTYKVDSGVDTVIDSGPAPFTNSTSASIAFHATLPGATFACRLDGAGPTSCSSPISYTGLAETSHSFSVAASAAGTTDPFPATRAWTVDTTRPPAPTNVLAAAASGNRVDLSWAASSDASGVASYDIIRNGTVIGSVSGGTTTSFDPSATASTSYTYTVDARDGAGNVSAESAPASVTTPSAIAPSLVQAAGSTSATVTLPTASTQGDLLVLAASVYTGATDNLTSVTDTGGNAWTRIGAYSASGHNSDGELWYCPNAQPTTAVTVHQATVVNTALGLQEFAGVTPTSPLDVAAGTSSTSSVAAAGPVTPLAANELLVGFAAGHGSTSPMTVGAGFSSQPQQTTGASFASLVTGYRVLSAPSAQSFTATFPTAMYWAAGIVAFKASG